MAIFLSLRKASFKEFKNQKTYREAGENKMDNDGEIKRHIAYKLSIGMINQGELQLEQDEEDKTKQRLRFMVLANKEINRVNIIANVVDKFQSEEKKYTTLTLDDGTGNIRVRAFSDNASILNNFNPGDTILVIGILRYFNGETYILPEIVKTIDTRWLIARKLELEKEYGELYKNSSKSVEQIEEIQEKEEVEEIEKSLIEDTIRISEENREPGEKPSLREKIVDMIKLAEAEEGIDIDKIIMNLSEYSVEDINAVITSLLEEGTVYEPRPGRLRIL